MVAMRFNPNIHNYKHLAKNLVGHLENTFTNIQSEGELLVVNYHGTQKKFVPNLKAQLNYFNDHYNIISPSELDKWYQGSYNKETSLLITFDDGIKNNLYAVEELDKIGKKSLFFVITGFINCEKETQKDFFVKNIRQHIVPEIDSKDEDFSSLNWEDLQEMYRAGHIIGAHSHSHQMNKQSMSEKDAHREIVESCKTLSIRLNSEINSFCAPNSSMYSVGQKEMDIIREYFTYFFSTIPGSNLKTQNPYFIHRSNIECFWQLGTVYNSIGTWDHSRWKSHSNNFSEEVFKS